MCAGIFSDFMRPSTTFASFCDSFDCSVVHITGKDFTEMYYFVQLPHPLLVHVSVVDLYVTMNTLQDTRHITLHVLKEVKNIYG